MEKFDVVIIGSGPGGYVAAIRSGQLGLKTALVEKDKELGGTCLNVGCIPSKALLTSSDHFMFVKKEAAKHGIVIDGARADLAKMQERKDKVVKTFNGGVRSLMKTNKVTVFEGLGTITAPGKVSDQIVQAARRRRSRRRTSSSRPAARRWNCRSRNLTAKQSSAAPKRWSFTEASKETGRYRRGRDWPRAGLRLEPARFGSDDAGISAAHRARVRSRTVEPASAFAHRSGHDVSISKPKLAR